ncbi:hypothetical protein OF001_U140087 [Pseudomonas sp. OF001]|nr:hypothetical protein OF001_U140087 [Pseudomonas sp. OF001]
MEFGADHDGHLPGLRGAADALGPADPAAGAEPAAGLAAAGLLPEHPGGLRRLRRGAGPLGGVAGQRHPGADPAGHPRRGGRGRQPVAGAGAGRGAQPAGLRRRAAGGRRLGAGGAGAVAARRAPPGLSLSLPRRPAACARGAPRRRTRRC